MRIGILGGTFDPPHIAHLLAGECAYRQLGLDRVVFIPAGVPWQKSDRAVTASKHRLQMTGLATDQVEYFETNDCEVERDGPTYTIETLERFSEEVVLILGADAASRLGTWHRYEEVLARAEIVVVPRPGVSLIDVSRVVPNAVELDVPRIDVSGTEIRRRVSRGASIKYLVPPPVIDYISEHGLYV